MESVKKTENVLAVVTDALGNISKQVWGSNIITDDGDTFYAQKIVGETSAFFETPYMLLGTGTTLPAKTDVGVELPITGAYKQVDAGMPQRDNQDTGNPDGGVNVVTWKFSFPLGGVVATGISEGAIVDDGAAPTNALNHFLFSNTFDLTDTDQLTIYVNHALVGV